MSIVYGTTDEEIEDVNEWDREKGVLGPLFNYTFKFLESTPLERKSKCAENSINKYRNNTRFEGEPTRLRTDHLGDNNADRLLWIHVYNSVIWCVCLTGDCRGILKSSDDHGRMIKSSIKSVTFTSGEYDESSEIYIDDHAGVLVDTRGDCATYPDGDAGVATLCSIVPQDYMTDDSRYSDSPFHCSIDFSSSSNNSEDQRLQVCCTTP